MVNKTVFMRSSETGEVFSTALPEYHADCENLGSGEKGKQARNEYCRAELRRMLKPKDVVYTVLRHRSASGMYREIGLFIVQDGELRNIDSLSADAMGYKRGKTGGLKVGGCGMDMGYHLVHTLGHYLWPNGTPEPHGMRNGEPDSAGGYALRHEWI